MNAKIRQDPPRQLLGRLAQGVPVQLLLLDLPRRGLGVDVDPRHWTVRAVQLDLGPIRREARDVGKASYPR